MSRKLVNLKELKDSKTGESVTFQAKALRVWESGGLRMALVGDASALTRIEVGDADIDEGASYEFEDAEVRTYPGGWHSASIADSGSAQRLRHRIEVPQDPAYVERTFKILSGVQRKKARKEGRAPAWEHPASKAE